MKRGDAAMTHGMRTGLLRLKIGSEHLSAMLFGFGQAQNAIDAEDLNEHDLRDLGMLDGRVSPSTVERVARPDAWDIIGQPRPWL
jgi:hypothetical protein